MHESLAIAYWGKRMYPQVIEEYKTWARLSEDKNNIEFAAALEQGFRSSGWKGTLGKAIEALKAQRKSGYASPYYIARLYADLGDKEHAFEWLNIAYQEHDRLLIWLKTDDSMDLLRSDPRFTELVHKVVLTE